MCNCKVISLLPLPFPLHLCHLQFDQISNKCQTITVTVVKSAFETPPPCDSSGDVSMTVHYCVKDFLAKCGWTETNYELSKTARITLDSACAASLLVDDRKMGLSIKAAERDGRGGADLWLLEPPTCKNEAKLQCRRQVE